MWLDAGEFSRIYDETKGAKVTSPLWAVAMAEAAAIVKQGEPPAAGDAPA